MEIQLINKELIESLLKQAGLSERKRQAFDLRTTPDDQSQRMLNALEVGTIVPIHRHEESSETNICISGRLDVIFYEKLHNIDAGGPGRDFKEFFRTELCPAKGNYGIQIPMGVWHTIEVKEPSCIFEGKDGKYKG